MHQKITDFLTYLKNKLLKEKKFTPKTFEIYPYSHDRQLNPSTKSFLREYDEYTESSFNYDGVRDKQYYIADSSIFKDYIDEVLSNPNTSFKTYIHDTIKSGYYPQNINCIRLTRPEQHYGLEVLASNILNYFKVPTAYYRKIQSLDENENKVLEHILSIDFISKGEELRPLGEVVFTDTSYIENILDRYKNEVYSFYKVNRKMPLHEKENIDKKILLDNESMVKSFLVRACLMNDTDMKARNLGIIHNKEQNTIYPAPNFDLEFCLMHTIIKPDSLPATAYNVDILKTNLTYIYDNYPNVLDEFMKEAEELLYPKNHDDNKLSHIITTAKNNGEPTSTPIKNLYANYELIFKKTNQLKMEKEENENGNNKQ